MRAVRLSIVFVIACCLFAATPLGTVAVGGQASLPAPEQFLGFRVGADTKLARWDKIVEFMKLVQGASDRVRVRELGKSTEGNPFIAVEITSPETQKRMDYFKGLQRRLYFQDGVPTDAQRDEIFQQGKAVVVVTCNIHSTEIGSSQMVLELVHRLATDNSPRVKHVLDNVIFVLVPSLNPDGQIMVVDWYNKNLGTPFENSGMPWLYQKYVGHDNNRDMYMFTQAESRLTAKLLWHDWFPAVWLDEHQQGSGGARIFVMPATDPINPNVHPLIYRWNGIFGQTQGAALETAGKDGIIYNSTYTNFWQGAMAWSGWWHNQVGLLTEVASVRTASPTDQRRAELGRPPAPAAEGGGRGAGGGPSTGSGQGRGDGGGQLAAPTDVTPRTEYPRPWLGGRWTLRDIVDYELIATMATLELAADQRETLLRQIYEVNRATIEMGKKGDPSAIVIAPGAQADPLAAYRLVGLLQTGGVKVYQANAAFKADEQDYAAGTFVIPMTQVFARYAKDLLEKQTYPEVRRSPNAPPEPPYDVTAWSLGMLLGVDVSFVKTPIPESVGLTLAADNPRPVGTVTGAGAVFSFDYTGPDAALAINRLFKAGAKITVAPGAGVRATTIDVSGIPAKAVQQVATSLGLQVRAPAKGAALAGTRPLKAPRVALYQPWSGNMDEGWTRWVIEQYEFPYTTLHNADIKAGKLADRFDAIVLADQQPASIVAGNESPGVRPEYRGGIGEDGIKALKDFVAAGGTLVLLGNACDLAIERFPLPVKNLKRGLTREQHFAPGTIMRVEVDAASPLGAGVAPSTYGFYNNSPFFALTEGFASQKVSVVARYPNTNVVASGWLRGEEFMTGRAAVITVDMTPGRIVLFGLRPQHRAQTQATFPLLFNALYLSAR